MLLKKYFTGTINLFVTKLTKIRTIVNIISSRGYPMFVVVISDFTAKSSYGALSMASE